MAQQFYQPQKGRRQDDSDSIYDEPLIPTSPNAVRSQQASEDAADTTSDIDDVLRENDEDGLFNAGGDDDLATQESAAAGGNEAQNSEAAEGGALAAAEGDQVGNGYQDRAAEGQKRERFRGLLSGKRKWVAVGVGGGLTGMILVVIALLLIASSLKIPNLAQHITSYEFARVTRQLGQSTQRVTDQQLALAASKDGTSKSLYAKFAARYAPKTAGKVSETWAKFDNYRPQKVIESLGNGNGLQLKYTKAGQFTGATLDGIEYSVKKPGVSRFIPGVSSILDFKNNVQFSRQFEPALQTSMRANTIAPIIRGSTANAIRKELNISLLAWNLGKFTGKNPTQAQLEEVRQKAAKIDSKLTNNAPHTAELADAAAADAEATQNALANDATLTETIKSGGIVKSAQQALDQALTDSGVKIALGVVDPLYAIALPVCIVFDGSVDQSGGTINNSTQQAQAAYYYIASAADQQKEGTTNATDAANLAKVVRVANADLGNISNSPAEVKAAGGTPDTTASIISPEAGAGAQYTLLDAIPGIGQYLSVFNGFATGTCGLATNTVLAGGIGLLNLLATLASLGSAEVVEQGAGRLAIKVTDDTAKGIFERLVTRVISQKSYNVTSRASKLIYGTGKDVGKSALKIAAATVLAKLIVMNYAASVNGGLTQGTDLAILGGAGGTLQAGELSRKQGFGRPLTNPELAQTDQTDTQYVDAQNASKSFTDRYLATSNANSLVSRMATDVSANFSGGVMAALAKAGSSLLHPLSLLGSLIGKLNHKALAAPDPNTQHYGIVQFGWSPDEEALIDSDPSYQVLANQEVLDASGNEPAIAQKYARCFGYSSDDQGNLTLDPDNNGDGSLGMLLSSGDIRRDDVGNIVDRTDSLCAPSNLSFDNRTDSNAVDRSGGAKTRDMIFRWRLAMSYDQTLNQLAGEQSVSK